MTEAEIQAQLAEKEAAAEGEWSKGNLQSVHVTCDACHAVERTTKRQNEAPTPCACGGVRRLSTQEEIVGVDAGKRTVFGGRINKAKDRICFAERVNPSEVEGVRRALGSDGSCVDQRGRITYESRDQQKRVLTTIAKMRTERDARCGTESFT